jgi:nitrogen-specific signal transduction histidine kinase
VRVATGLLLGDESALQLPQVKADSERVAQVLRGLTSNALRDIGDEQRVNRPLATRCVQPRWNFPVIIVSLLSNPHSASTRFA